MKRFDNVCYGLADARNFSQTFLGNHLIQRKAKCEQIVRRASVGFCTERVASTQRAPLREFTEQGGNGGGVEHGHIIVDGEQLRSSTLVRNGLGNCLL